MTFAVSANVFGYASLTNNYFAYGTWQICGMSFEFKHLSKIDLFFETNRGARWDLLMEISYAGGPLTW